ncbi:MAG: 4-(cytidine 5'-diphospho)-2-C-methyl-D-erythritol kinase [Actinomycetota bacterium]
MSDPRQRRLDDGSIVRAAPAKLNVFLRIRGARDDGYHDLESLVLPLSLADTVTVASADALRVDVGGDDAFTSAVDAGGMNLALVAALALGESCSGGPTGATITIDKRIPVAAGLGGGSADAAAVLLALQSLWGCGLDTETLLEIAARIGSDVPSMVLGGAVVLRGRGERLEPVDVVPTWWCVVPFDFPTRSPDAYRWWDDQGGVTGPDPAPALDAIREGNVGELGRLLHNDLEPVVVARHPVIGRTKEALLDAGALGAVMSGSGPTVVALARTELHATELAGAFPGAITVSAPWSGAGSVG